MARRPAGSLEYQPALDGVRSVAVLAVVVFHGGAGWLTGGYLGVSVFFTLSGFLITRLLLDEHARDGRIDLGRFYSRRIRRLIPASCLCLALGTAVGWFESTQATRREVAGAALQVSNWVQLTSERSYGDLFQAGVSPVTHFWSLAIEEQFYLVWPIVFIGAIALARRRRTAVLTLMTVGGARPRSRRWSWARCGGRSPSTSRRPRACRSCSH